MKHPTNVSAATMQFPPEVLPRTNMVCLTLRERRSRYVHHFLHVLPGWPKVDRLEATIDRVLTGPKRHCYRSAIGLEIMNAGQSMFQPQSPTMLDSNDDEMWKLLIDLPEVVGPEK